MVFLLWAGFVLFVLVMLMIDLGVFNRQAHAISMREALAWTTVWVALALLFNVGIYFMYEHHLFGVGIHLGHPVPGRQAALEFFTGYLLEKSLSLDNIFVIAVIFGYFAVPLRYQHRALFWGVLGALVMRGTMIVIGVKLFSAFPWVTYVFGAFLLYAAAKMVFAGGEQVDPDHNPLVRLARRFYPVTASFDDGRFFTRLADGRRAITPLFVVLLVIESTDLLFAVDSIPAILAITQDPFIVFTSNVFAILGLRALYFFLAAVLNRFRYVKHSLGIVLAFVGVKMLLAHYFHIPAVASLGIIVAILTVGIVASIITTRKTVVPISSSPPGGLGVWAQLTLRQARRLIIFVVGITVVLIGVVMVALPGPATIVIPAGLAILATEFIWARLLLQRIKRMAVDFGSRMTGRSSAPAADHFAPQAGSSGADGSTEPPPPERVDNR